MATLRYLATALVLLGLVPVFVYFGGPSTYFALSLGCVLLVAATLYLAFGSANGDQEHSADAR